MSMSPSSMASAKELVETEEVVKLEVDEKQLPQLQYVYEMDEATDKDLSEEEEVFKQMPPWKQCIYNEMVEFKKELRQLGMANNLRHIIHAQQEQINPPMPEEIAKREMATATALTSIIKTETTATPVGPVKCITPILIKEEPSEIYIMKIVNTYKSKLPTVPDHMFIRTKREPDDPAESYSEYETDCSDYVEDDVEIPLETDSDEVAEFVDETLTFYNVENIERGLAKVQDGFLMAASGYEDLRSELPNLNPTDISKLIEQVPMPQMTELSKPLKQLLSKTSEKTVIQKFIQQLLSEGQSIHNISKEFGLPYNLVYKVTHGTK